MRWVLRLLPKHSILRFGMGIGRLLCSAIVLCSVAKPSGLPLCDGRLSVDLAVVAGAKWYASRAYGLSSKRFVFSRDASRFGISARPVSGLLIRYYSDPVVGLGPLDLYVDFAANRHLSILAGQFLLPLGMESSESICSSPFAGNTLVKNRWKPYDERDVGVMFAYKARGVAVDVAVVNGNGRNNPFNDENKSKDVAFRVAVGPLRGTGVLVAVRAYYGAYGVEERPFANLAGEVAVDAGRLKATSEWQFSDADSDVRGSAYLQASYALAAFIEPAVRADVEYRSSTQYELAATCGIMSRFFDGALCLRLNAGRWSAQVPGVSGEIDEYRVVTQVIGRL